MYEVYLRNWDSGVNTATIYKSNDLKECKDFAEKWNDATDKLYNEKSISDEYRFFADVYDVEKNKYVFGF